MTSGTQNTAVGIEAAQNLTTGSFNVAMGRQALNNSTDGTFNTALGYNAGNILTSGDNNTCVGHEAGSGSSPGGGITTGNNIIILGNNSITDFKCKVSLSVTSDRRDKTDITPFNHGLSWINKLNPVTYRWDNRSDYENGVPDGSKKGTQLNLGLIAQEELEVEKEHGYGDDRDSMLITDVSEDGNHFSMKYEKLVPILINAVKELSAEVEHLKSQLNN